MTFATLSEYSLLIDHFLPERSQYQQCLVVFISSILVALSAQICIPLPSTPIPITGQTFTLMLIATTLGSRLGAYSLLCYLFEGAIGLPVFANAASGLHVLLLAPSSGYLLSLPLAAWLIGFGVEKFGVDRNPAKLIIAITIGLAIVYGFGLLWLGKWLLMSNQNCSFTHLINLGLFPFIVGDLLKLLLATMIIPLFWYWISFK